MFHYVSFFFESPQIYKECLPITFIFWRWAVHLSENEVNRNVIVLSNVMKNPLQNLPWMAQSRNHRANQSRKIAWKGLHLKRYSNVEPLFCYCSCMVMIYQYTYPRTLRYRSYERSIMFSFASWDVARTAPPSRPFCVLYPKQWSFYSPVEAIVVARELQFMFSVPGWVPATVPHKETI